jgi:Tol biopolymer transport system component
MPARGGEPTALVATGFGGTAWSADSKRIVYVDPGQSLFEINVDTKTTRPLDASPTHDMAPSVSPSGRLAYGIISHEVNLVSYQIAPPHKEEPITNNSGENFFASFAPGGRRLVYQSDRSGNDDIWMRDLDKKEDKRLTTSSATDQTPSWSPTGEKIAFLSGRGGKLQLWVMDGTERSEGQNQKLLTEQAVPPSGGWSAAEIAPQWSPDGKWIAFIARNDQGVALWVVDREGNNARPVLLDRVLYFDWYLDNQHLIFGRRADSGRVEVHAFDLNTRKETTLLRQPGIEFATARDGSKLLFTSAASHFGMNLFVLPLRRGPDGMPVAAGMPTPITDGKSHWHAHKGAWSPDGKTVVYTRDADVGDIYTLEGYK